MYLMRMKPNFFLAYFLLFVYVLLFIKMNSSASAATRVILLISGALRIGLKFAKLKKQFSVLIYDCNSRERN